MTNIQGGINCGVGSPCKFFIIFYSQRINHIFATKRTIFSRQKCLNFLIYCDAHSLMHHCNLLSLAHSGSLSGSLSHILAHYGSLRRSSAYEVHARLSTSWTHGHSLSRPANFISFSIITTTTTTNTTTIIIIITRPQPAWPRVDRLALPKLSWVHSESAHFLSHWHGAPNSWE